MKMNNGGRDEDKGGSQDGTASSCLGDHCDDVHEVVADAVMSLKDPSKNGDQESSVEVAPECTER